MLTTGTTPPPTAPSTRSTGTANSAGIQVAQTLSYVATRTGPHHVTVQLHPADLGRITIDLSRSDNGEARVHISAESADTLTLVRLETAELHAALDQAGIGAEGRVISYEVAPQPTHATAAPTALNADAQAGGSGPAGQDMPGSSGRQTPQHEAQRAGPLVAQPSSSEPGIGATLSASDFYGARAIRLRAVDLTA